MPASTPSGWPYVQGSDLATQYPITSQALAEKLETFRPVTTLRTGYAAKGTDQSGIPSNGGCGFGASIANVPANALVVGLISHVGSVTVAGNVYMGPSWGGGTGSGTAPQLSAGTSWFNATYIGHCISAGGTVSLSYILTTSGGATWTCHARTTILLVAI